MRAGVYQRIGRGQRRSELRALAAIGQHRDVVGEATVFAAADQQQVIGLAQPLERVEQHRNVLLVREAAGIGEQARARGEAEFLAQRRHRGAAD